MVMGRMHVGARRRGRKLNDRQKAQVKRLVNVGRESKHLDFNNGGAGGTEATTSGAIVSISDIAQGSTDSTRDGDKCMIRRIYGHVRVQRDTQPAKGDEVRFIIFQWKENSALVAPTLGAILFDTTSNGTLSNTQMDFKPQFRILLDKIVNLQGHISSHVPSSDVAVYSREQRGFSFNINPKRFAKQIQFSGSTSATNKIYYLVLGDKLTGSDASTLFLQSRIEFTDA